jgi:hypothetical protein
MSVLKLEPIADGLTLQDDGFVWSSEPTILDYLQTFPKVSQMFLIFLEECLCKILVLLSGYRPI